MAGNEILTLQIGHYANFLGTHWWNLQEAAFSYDPKFPSEINSDILFREGYTPQGVTTYLPRLVSIDLKGSLKSLKNDGVLYKASNKEESNFWGDSLETHKTSPFLKNEYLKYLESQEKLRNEVSFDDDEKDVCQVSNSSTVLEDVLPQTFNLDSAVDVWSDYLCMHLHPRSIHLINEYLHKNDVEPFDVFYYGLQVTSEENEVDDIENRIRFFVEECDSLQGFHLLFDARNGFGGVATAIASYLGDEFKSKSLLSIPVFDISSGEKKAYTDQTSVLNSLLSLEKISALSSLVLPLSCFKTPWFSASPFREFPFLNFNKDLPYHSSAVLASAIDTATIFYRRKENSTDLRELVDSLGVYGRKFAALSAVFPFPMHRDVSVIETVLRCGPDVTPQSLTPSCDIACSQSLIQHLIFRGLPAGAKINIKEVSEQLIFPKPLTCFDDVLSWFANKMWPCTFSSLNKLTDGLKVSDPFPHIFDSKVSHLGMICPEDRPPGRGVTSVPILSGVHSSNNLKNTLTDLLTSVAALNIRKLHSFTNAGLEQDEFVQTVENVKVLMSCYDNY